jgi:hypothetical protein
VKKLLAILLCALFVAALVGCTGQTPEPAPPPNLPVDIPDEPPSLNEPMDSPDEPLLPEVSDSLTTFVSVHSEGLYVPISHILNGEEQLLVCDVYGVDLFTRRGLEEIFTLPNIEELCKIDVRDMFAPGSALPLHIENGWMMDTLHSNGDWDFFPEQVTYSTYTWQNQPNNAEWYGFMRAQLDEAGVETPVIIRNTWSFKWNGTPTVLVNFGNWIWNSNRWSIAAPNPPPPADLFKAVFPCRPLRGHWRASNSVVIAPGFELFYYFIPR